MSSSLFERIRLEVHRRLGADGEVDTSDLHVTFDADVVLIQGSVDDAFSKSLVESVVREIAGSGRVTSRISVRDDLGAEGQAKETEFGTAEAARATMS